MIYSLKAENMKTQIFCSRLELKAPRVTAKASWRHTCFHGHTCSRVLMPRVLMPHRGASAQAEVGMVMTPGVHRANPKDPKITTQITSIPKHPKTHQRFSKQKPFFSILTWPMAKHKIFRIIYLIGKNSNFYFRVHWLSE